MPVETKVSMNTQTAILMNTKKNIDDLTNLVFATDNVDDLNCILDFSTGAIQRLYTLKNVIDAKISYESTKDKIKKDVLYAK